MQKFGGTFIRMNGSPRYYPILSSSIIHPHQSNTNSYSVFCIHLIVGENCHDQRHRHLSPIPYDTNPLPLIVQHILATNIGPCIPLDSMGMPAYIFHGGEVKFSLYPLMKGTSNDFFVLYDLYFRNHSHNVDVDYFMRDKYHTFSH